MIGLCLIPAIAIVGACGSDASVGPDESRASLRLLAGSAQQGLPDSLLPQPIVAYLADKRGQPIGGAPVRFRVIAGGGEPADTVVTTDPGGTAIARWRAGSAGQQAMEVSAPGAAPDTVRATLLDPLVILAADSEFVRDSIFHVRGAHLGGAIAILAGDTASVRTTGDTLLEISLPRAAFEPCVPIGRQLRLELNSNHGQLAIYRRARPVPYAMSLAPAQHLILVDSLAEKCDIALPAGAQYLVAPFRADPPGWDETAVAVTVTVSASGASSNVSPLHAITRAVQNPYGRRASASPRSVDVIMPPRARRSGPAGAQDTSVETCALPSAFNDSIPIVFSRDSATGAITYSTDHTTEFWHLVATNSTLAFFADSSTMRVFRSDPARLQRVQALTQDYDSLIAPVFARLLPPIPDHDGNRKVVVLISAVTKGMPAGLAFPDYALRADCQQAGETIFLNAQYLTEGSSTNASIVIDLAHELAHIIDVEATPGGHAVQIWRLEGFASLVELLVIDRSEPEPLFANYADYQTFYYGSVGSGIACVLTQRPDSIRFLPHGGGCARLGYLFAQAQRFRNATLHDVIAAYERSDPQYQFGQVADFLGLPHRTASQAQGEWYLSWFADDQVSGTDPIIQNPVWNVPAIQTKQPLPSAPVDADIGDAGGKFAATLAGPDIRFVRVTLSGLGSSRMQLRSAATDTTHAAHFGVLRIR